MINPLYDFILILILIAIGIGMLVYYGTPKSINYPTEPKYYDKHEDKSKRNKHVIGHIKHFGTFSPKSYKQ